ncbi:MAG: metallophosphoesterase [Elusimicrobia bacterium]|nr:metallophosphoesterase [Elusimicrobiota bacterium]
MPTAWLLASLAFWGTLWALPGAREPRPLSFAIVTDLHIGDGVEDFGSVGYDDRPGSSLPAHPAILNGRAAVEKINALAASRGVAFVIVLGDLTDSAERSEFAAAKLILDKLTIPYVPMLGNHDIWPATKAGISPVPDGPRYFEEVFGPRLHGLTAAFPDLARAGSERGLQNWAFSLRGVGFVLADWNSRGRVHGGPDPAADLHDGEGGTFRWLEDLVRDGWMTSKTRVFLTQHHPLRMKVPGTSPPFAFSSRERARIKAILRSPAAGSRFAAVLSGHEHRDFIGPAFPDWPGLAQIEASAAKDGPAVTVITMESPTDYSLSRH